MQVNFHTHRCVCIQLYVYSHLAARSLTGRTWCLGFWTASPACLLHTEKSPSLRRDGCFSFWISFLFLEICEEGIGGGDRLSLVAVDAHGLVGVVPLLEGYRLCLITQAVQVCTRLFSSSVSLASPSCQKESPTKVRLPCSTRQGDFLSSYPCRVFYRWRMQEDAKATERSAALASWRERCPVLPGSLHTELSACTSYTVTVVDVDTSGLSLRVCL